MLEEIPAPENEIVGDKKNNQKKIRRIVYWCILLFFLLVVLELAAFLAFKLVPGQVYYQPPTDADMENYRAMMKKPNFSPTLSWLPRPELVTAEGRRKSPDAENLKEIASVYGDSFAFGDDVGDDDAWANVLSKKLNRRVNNFGVSFYSNGQSLLRFMENASDTPEIAIFAAMSENIVRNVNQNASFIYSQGVLFRPIWHLDGDGISLEPIPDVADMTAAEYKARERDLLRYEYFWPESSPLAKYEARFPYLYNLPRAILFNKRIMRGLLDEIGIHAGSWYLDLYQPAHESQAYELTLRIYEKFVSVAKERGIKRPIVLFLPRDRDIDHFRASGSWGYEGFLAEAQKRLPEFYALTDYIAKDFADKDDKTVKDYFHTARWRGVSQSLGQAQREVGGHYSEKGNLYLAEIMAGIIQEKQKQPAL